MRKIKVSESFREEIGNALDRYEKGEDVSHDLFILLNAVMNSLEEEAEDE